MRQEGGRGGAIQGKEGIKFCHLATLREGGSSRCRRRRRRAGYDPGRAGGRRAVKPAGAGVLGRARLSSLSSGPSGGGMTSRGRRATEPQLQQVSQLRTNPIKVSSKNTLQHFQCCFSAISSMFSTLLYNVVVSKPVLPIQRFCGPGVFATQFHTTRCGMDVVKGREERRRSGE